MPRGRRGTGAHGNGRPLAVSAVSRPGVAHVSVAALRRWAALGRRVDVAAHRVDEVDLVAVVREPGGVRAGAAADVQDPQGAGRQLPPDDLLGPHELEAPRAATQALGLGDLALVVVPNLGGRLGHGASVPRAGRGPTRARDPSLRARPPVRVVRGAGWPPGVAGAPGRQAREDPTRPAVPTSRRAGGAQPTSAPPRRPALSRRAIALP